MAMKKCAAVNAAFTSVHLAPLFSCVWLRGLIIETEGCTSTTDFLKLDQLQFFLILFERNWMQFSLVQCSIICPSSPVSEKDGQLPK